MNTVTPPRLFDAFAEATPAAWRKAAEDSLAGAPFDKKLVTRTPEGIDLQPIYTREDAESLTAKEAMPGIAPYLRGSNALGARPNGWLIAQELPYGKPDLFNQALIQDLNRGQNCVNLLFDVATRLGLDPDMALAGEVGGCGLSLATLDDVGRALRGVDLSAVPVHAPAGISALSITALLVAWLAEQGKKPQALHGAILSDPLTDWLGLGSLPVSLAATLDEMAELTAWAEAAKVPIRTIGIQAGLWADAGGTAVHELAFGLSTGIDYLRELSHRHVPVDVSGRRAVMTFSLGSHFFMEIAKLRASRLLWARAVGAAGGGAEAQRLQVHGRTSMWNKTVLDPHVNLLRATTEAFAGVMGGCASLHVGAFDECFRVPDDFSRRLARNIQIILAEECLLGQVVDPVGGSWYVETLTRQLAERAWALFQEVERAGGMAAALAKGMPQEAVAKSARERVAAVESRRDGVIGTNLHPNLKERPESFEAQDYAALAVSRARQIIDYRTSPGVERGEEVLSRLASLLGSHAPGRMDLLVSAFAHGATLGEVNRVLRAGRAEGTLVTKVRIQRRSASFEALRRRAASHKERTGSLPKVFLANMGPRKQFAARADFSAGFFAAGGFEAITNKGFETPQEAAAAAIASGAPVVVICSTDETYPSLVPPLAQALKAAPHRPKVILAGLPTAQVEALRAAGIDEFIHLRANCAQVLSKLQDELAL